MAIVLLTALVFGIVAAWAKEPGAVSAVSEVRNFFGNLSTPWLLVAFVAGSGFSRLRTAALAGLLATTVALVGFYLLSSIVQDLGGHGFVADLRLELFANRGYIEGGLFTGPLFGALGSWWRRTRTQPASIFAGAVYAAEFALGLGLVLLAARRAPRSLRAS
jgi:Family of unknown function (DUF6518)